MQIKFVDPTTRWKNLMDRNFTIDFQGWGGLVYPNPETSFNYGIPYSSDVSIKIHNSLGQLIYKIIYQNHQPGLYSFKWNPENISSGTYYIQLISDDIVITKKAIYLK